MTDFKQNKLEAPVNTPWRNSWWFIGSPQLSADESMRLFWQVEFVEGKGWGIVLRSRSCALPSHLLEITQMQDQDVFLHNGEVFWKEGGNGLCIKFNGEIAPLMTLEKVVGGIAQVYFHFLPVELDTFKSGHIFITNDVNLESSVVG